MPVLGAFILPHPPVIIPEVGGGREEAVKKTTDSFEQVAARIEALRPDTIVLTSPHSVMYADYFHISPGERATGGFAAFGAPGVTVKAEYDGELAAAIEAAAMREGLPAGTLGERDRALDHGTTVPLYFINKRYSGYRLVRAGLSGLGAGDHYRFGRCIAAAAGALGRGIVFIASGDLSHKVAADGPYGFSPAGVEFDRLVTRAMAQGDFLTLMTLEPELISGAAECGLRSIIIMAGALDGLEVEPELLSYEGTLGVGYGVAAFKPVGQSESRRFLDAYAEREKGRLARIKASEDEYVRLARLSLETYVKTGARAAIPAGLPDELITERAGAFVSLKKHGELRGCIGTTAPVTGSLAEEIMRNAVSAGTQDPRFDPVTPDELGELVYSVDVLSPPQAIDSERQLDPARYGVIVTSGTRRGLLLPNLDGVDTVREQVDIARSKAGIAKGKPVSLERFEVVRHT